MTRDSGNILRREGVWGAPGTQWRAIGRSSDIPGIDLGRRRYRLARPGYRDSDASPHSTELKAELDAEHDGTPFLVFRVGDGQVVRILPEAGRLTLGREEACDFSFADDHEISRLHCELERVGGHWVLGDHGLSRNGTFLNGERLHGERALHDGDTIRLGTTG